MELSREDKEWIEHEAMMLVGSAAVFAEYRRWKMLEKLIAEKLRKAYERGACIKTQDKP